jgi:hypothetical protein
VPTKNKTSDALRTGVVIVLTALASCTATSEPTGHPGATKNVATPALESTTSGDATGLADPLAGALASSAGETGATSPPTLINDDPLAGALASSAGETGAASPPTLMNDDPQQLLGLAGTDVARRLGVPSLIRRNGTAKIWQYRATACILDVFLYASGDGHHVRHIELRSRNSTAKPHPRCFVGLLEAEKIRPSG